VRKIAIIAAAIALNGVCEAQVDLLRGNLSTRSHSGQFVVHAPAAGFDTRKLTYLTSNPNYVQLDPSLLVVSCERIKQLLLRRLAEKPTWRGKIFLNLRAAQSGNEVVTINSEKFLDGWQYRVQLPNVLLREQFVRAMVQVLLLEMSNRTAEYRSAEIPLWLVEGLSRDLLASGEIEIILPPPAKSDDGLDITRQSISARRPHPLERARAVLGAAAPLTFEELSWPTEEQISGTVNEVYQSSAQLFVDRLTGLQNGTASLRAMIFDLPKHLNWQLTFLSAFKPHFERTLDIEKWWAVQLTQFVGRDLSQTWSYAESWNKLDEAIRAPVQIRTTEKEIPLRAQVNLQSLLRDSNDGLEQREFYRQKRQALDSLRLRCAPDLVWLVDEYRQAISDFMERQNSRNPFLSFRRRGPLDPHPAVTDLIRRLDVLDARRDTLRPLPQSAATGAQNIPAAFP
jgi:hypothetical protein